MEPRRLAQVIAAGRVVIGVTLLAAPGLVARRWVGDEDGSRAGAQTLAGAVGGRDLALGVGVLASLARGSGARGWIAASALADLADFAVTLRERESLPGSSVVTTSLVAGGSAAAGAWLVAQDAW